MGKVENSIPKINVALDDHQAEYQPTMIKFQGKIFKHTIYIEKYLGENLSYINPRALELCHLEVNKFKNMWMFQSTTKVKRRVVATEEKYFFELLNQSLRVNLKVLRLGS